MFYNRNIFESLNLKRKDITADLSVSRSHLAVFTYQRLWKKYSDTARELSREKAEYRFGRASFRGSG